MSNTFILTYFWKHVKPYKWHYLLMMQAPLVSSFYPFAYNYAIKLFLDAMERLDSIAYSDVMFPIILFLSAQVTMDLVWRISNIAEWKSRPYVKQSLFIESYDRVQTHPYRFFQNNLSGAVASKLKGIMDGYATFWTEMHHGLLQHLLKIIVNLIALSFVSGPLALFLVVWCLVYISVIYKISVRLNVLSYEEAESRHRVIGQFSDRVANIMTLLSFATRKHELKILNNLIKDDTAPKEIRTHKYSFKLQLAGCVMYWILFAVILFMMINLRIAGAVSIGDFAFVFGISLMVAWDIWMATTTMQEFYRTMGDLKGSLSVLFYPTDERDEEGCQILKVTDPKIEFNNVNFSYENTKQVIRDLSLTIQPGEKVGLVGHSGAGKSTLINLLLRYFQEQEGEILISGVNLKDCTFDSIREAIAVIPQDTLLFHRTLMENIRYGNLNATDDEVIVVSKKAHIHEFVSQLPDQYQTYVGERGLKLSGGQRQRVSIARAMLKDAPILLLDEATSSLDSHTEQLIQESLNILIEDKSKTVVAIAHRLSTLKHMDRIVVLDRGRIVEEGTHHALLRRKGSLYKRLWELQEV